MEILRIIYCLLFFMVGMITFSVGNRFLLAKEFFPYHSEATGLKWEEVNNQLKVVILAIMKMAGLGILCLAIMVVISSIYIFWSNNIFSKYLVCLVCLFFWIGSFCVTFSVYKKTKANTPWKGSLVSVFLSIVTIVISYFVK